MENTTAKSEYRCTYCGKESHIIFKHLWNKALCRQCNARDKKRSHKLVNQLPTISAKKAPLGYSCFGSIFGERKADHLFEIKKLGLTH